MTGISYGLVDFVTGGPILDLPVMEGASWSTQLNRGDEVTCSIDLNDKDARALDLRSSSAPNKTILLAKNDDDKILAFGLIGDDGRKWNEDRKMLTLSVSGLEDSYFGKTIIAPSAARTAPLVTLDPEGYPTINPALNTTISGVSHGTIGKRLVAQRLAWPGAPTIFDLPADEAGFRTQTYLLSSLKRIGPALSDLTKQEQGPDFAFEGYRAPDGLGLRIRMLHGSEAVPRLGAHVGTWSLGENSPLIGFNITDAVGAGASAGWMTAGRQEGAALISRVLNPDPIAAGYPPFDVVDTSHSDVSVQGTLDSYNAANMQDAQDPIQDLEFSVRADATPALGSYRPGDRITIDVPAEHPWHTKSIEIRITSISGNEVSDVVKIGCVVLDD